MNRLKLLEIKSDVDYKIWRDDRIERIYRIMTGTEIKKGGK